MKSLTFATSLSLLTLAAGQALALPALPPVPVPPQNPITESKRILGKALFWDEQLSTDNTMSCGTCHSAAQGGSDGRRARNPGFDGILNTADDTFGSPAEIKSDQFNNYLRDAKFGLAPQITGRNSMTIYGALFTTDAFWDGRASSTFKDPITNAVIIPTGGALESQVMGPPVSDVEMAHQSRSWNDVVAKLEGTRPLALAIAIPGDVRTAITAQTTYPDLFAQAFGDSAITPARIAMAIATYERTLVPDQTPWDRFSAGQTNALTPNQQAGLNNFNVAHCNDCHTAPQFTNNSFRNIGLRISTEDLGRQISSGLAADRGKMKVPSLRNVGLRTSFMHTGQFTTIPQVLGFYDQGPGAPRQVQENIDPIMAQVRVPPNIGGSIDDFISNGLTDQRVATRTFPFDQPTLYTQRPNARPVSLGGGTPGANAQLPTMIAVDPPLIGNEDFRVGVQNARGAASARVLVSTTPPVNGVLQTGDWSPVITLNGSTATDGYGTFNWSIPRNGNLLGRTYFLQWVITDAAAAGGFSRSNVTSVTLICGGAGCPPCPADYNADGEVNADDLGDYISSYFSGTTSIARDYNGDAIVNADDLSDFITQYFNGC